MAVFRLLLVDGCVFLGLGLMYLLFPHIPGQAYFFIGPAVPYPVPWRGAAFDVVTTQKGLKEAWPMVTTCFRALGGVDLLSGICLILMARHLLALQRAEEVILRRRGARGLAVHSRIEHFEQAAIAAAPIAPENKTVNIPPLWIIMLAHVACAAGIQYLRLVRPFPLEMATWATILGSGLHLLFALSSLICWMRARTMKRNLEEHIEAARVLQTAETAKTK